MVKYPGVCDGQSLCGLASFVKAPCVVIENEGIILILQPSLTPLFFCSGVALFDRLEHFLKCLALLGIASCSCLVAFAVDFTDLVYVRSHLYVSDQRRQTPDYEPPVAPLFGEKEGKIAKANRGRDPLYLFAALQWQLGYPEVPRIKGKEDPGVKLLEMQTKIKEHEQRIKLLEAEQRGKVDLSEFMAKPELLHQPEDDIS